MLIWLLASCSTAPSSYPEPLPTPAGVIAYLPDEWALMGSVRQISVDHALVVTASPVASEVGARILMRGGNAVDAAVAVGFALAVVHPSAGNIGGGGFMVIRTDSGESFSLDYRETAPAAATPDMYLDDEGNLTETSLTGHLAAGVPGSVAGLAEAHRRFGRLPLADLLAPAIGLARDGFVLDDRTARSIENARDRLIRFPTSAAQFLVDGEAPPSGYLLVQTDLARTLEAIARDGPRAFYEGWIADSIAAEMRRGGGLMTRDDLAAYRPVWRDPVVFSYRGYTGYSMPPASSGGTTLALILNMLEGVDPIPAFGTPEHAHLLAEVMRRAFVDRNHYLGDPAFVDMPLGQLLSKEYARARADDIDPAMATPSPGVVPGIAEGDHTTHYSVVDAEGNAVSVTTTINTGFGSTVTVRGAGFLLNNEMDDFTAATGQPNVYGLVQGQANAIEPGKRMLSAMTPTIVLDPYGDPFLLLGSPGGPAIISTVAQVISNVIDHGMSLASAVAAPRIHHQALPDRLRYERGGLAGVALERLRDMGHEVEELHGYMGEISAIQRMGNIWVGVADPRWRGGAAGF